MSNRYQCEECLWIGPEEEMQKAKHPFIEGYELYGCPSCGDVKFAISCEVPKCRHQYAGGMKCADGELHALCAKHLNEQLMYKQGKTKPPGCTCDIYFAAECPIASHSDAYK
jgi:predicted RNA-binding Zn-ribbon protein involved in translation (DUF1610 family)